MHPAIKTALVLGASLLEEMPSTKTSTDRYSPDPKKPASLLITGDESIYTLNENILGILSNIQFDFILITDTAGAEYQIQRALSLTNLKILRVCYIGLYPRNVIRGAPLVKLPCDTNVYRDIKLVNECTFHVGIVESFDEPTRSHSIHNSVIRKGKHSLLIDNTTLQSTQRTIKDVGTV